MNGSFIWSVSPSFNQFHNFYPNFIIMSHFSQNRSPLWYFRGPIIHKPGFCHLPLTPSQDQSWSSLPQTDPIPGHTNFLHNFHPWSLPYSLPNLYRRWNAADSLFICTVMCHYFGGIDHFHYASGEKWLYNIKSMLDESVFWVCVKADAIYAEPLVEARVA